MAQTETRPGFKLPWATEKMDADRPKDDARDSFAPPDGPTTTETTEELVTTDMIDSTPPAPARKPPTKFMADLSRAMQTAAEASRDETMARFLAESKTAVEEIQATSTVEAAALRRRADDDVATVREWSKAEIARIREETEARISARKAALDSEIDAHALVVEARVQRVGATIESFQAEMEAFFERLMAEGDPTRIATMAETMPDPPDLASVAAAIAVPDVEPFDPLQARLPATTPEPTVAAIPPEDGPSPFGAADAHAAPDSSEVREPSTDDLAAEAEAAMAARLDFAAAEAEALAFAGDIDDDSPSATAPVADAGHAPPVIPVLAQADGGTLPPPADAVRSTTRVVVLGLVSVASIATFKRGLARSEGVHAVGVTSGPDGEFVFTVEHDSDMHLGETVTTLPGFEARITAESPGTVEVTAHDPDTGD